MLGVMLKPDYISNIHDIFVIISNVWLGVILMHFLCDHYVKIAIRHVFTITSRPAAIRVRQNISMEFADASDTEFTQITTQSKFDSWTADAMLKSELWIDYFKSKVWRFVCIITKKNSTAAFYIFLNMYNDHSIFIECDSKYIYNVVF